MDQPFHDHRQDQVPLWATLGRDDGIQAELSDGSQHGFDVAVRKSLASGEEILWRDEGLVPKQSPRGLDLLRRPVREIRQSTLQGLFAFPPTFTEEDGERGVTIGDGFDVHGSHYAH